MCIRDRGGVGIGIGVVPGFELPRRDLKGRPASTTQMCIRDRTAPLITHAAAE